MPVQKLTIDDIILALRGTAFSQWTSSGTSPEVILIGTSDRDNIQWHTIDFEKVVGRLASKLDVVLLEGGHGKVDSKVSPLTVVADVYSDLQKNDVDVYFNDDLEQLVAHRALISSSINSQDARTRENKIVAKRDHFMVYGDYGLSNFSGIRLQFVGKNHLPGIINSLSQLHIPYFSTYSPADPSARDILDIKTASYNANSKDFSSRFISAQLLGKHPLVLSRSILKSMVDDSSGKVAREVILSLNNLDPSKSVPELVRLLSYPDETTRWYAAEILHTLPSEKKPQRTLSRRLVPALVNSYAGISTILPSYARPERTHSFSDKYTAFLHQKLSSHGVSSSPITSSVSNHPITRHYSYDRVFGSLLGLSIGDALGAPIENMSLAQIHKQFGIVTNYVNWGKYESGVYTDDTEMSLAIMQAIMNTNGISPRAIAAEFIAKNDYNFANRIDRGYSAATLNCLRRIKAGLPIEFAGNYSTGSGSIMRVAPLVAVSSDLLNDVLAVSRITHTHEDALLSSYAIALGIKQSYEAINIDKHLYIDSLVDGVRNHHSYLALEIQKLHDVVDLRSSEAFRKIGFSQQGSLWGKGSMNVALLSLYSFLHSPDDFDHSIQTAVNNSGDSDTIGAVTGALSGAFNGRKKIPPRFYTTLLNNNDLYDTLHGFANFAKKE